VPRGGFDLERVGTGHSQQGSPGKTEETLLKLREGGGKDLSLRKQKWKEFPF